MTELAPPYPQRCPAIASLLAFFALNTTSALFFELSHSQRTLRHVCNFELSRVQPISQRANVCSERACCCNVTYSALLREFELIVPLSTGGAQGLGAHFVYHFITRGWKVAVLDLDQQAMKLFEGFLQHPPKGKPSIDTEKRMLFLSCDVCFIQSALDTRLTYLCARSRRKSKSLQPSSMSFSTLVASTPL